jgi:predicted ATPase with chaperone activity
VGGLPVAAVQEAWENVQAAVGKITANLIPADLV